MATQGHNDEEHADTALPQRELRDPAELRALAHPVRLAILDLLVQIGPATATELANEFQDESPANCSWHLRQLARYGFIEEAGTGPGRQRRWRLVLEGTIFGTGDEQPELARAVSAAQEVMLDRQVQTLRAWRMAKGGEPDQWRTATVDSQSWTWLTAEEMAEFGADFARMLQRHIVSRMNRVDPGQRPAGSRPVRLVTWLVPTGPPHDHQRLAT